MAALVWLTVLAHGGVAGAVAEALAAVAILAIALAAWVGSRRDKEPEQR